MYCLWCGSLWRALLFRSKYLGSLQTFLWNSIVKKRLYLSFRRCELLLFGCSHSTNHQSCLLVSSVIQGRHKQCWHSSASWFWFITYSSKCGSLSSVSCEAWLLVMFSAIGTSLNSQSLCANSWWMVSLWVSDTSIAKMAQIPTQGWIWAYRKGHIEGKTRKNWNPFFSTLLNITKIIIKLVMDHQGAKKTLIMKFPERL